MRCALEVGSLLRLRLWRRVADGASVVVAAAAARLRACSSSSLSSILTSILLGCLLSISPVASLLPTKQAERESEKLVKTMV